MWTALLGGVLLVAAWVSMLLTVFTPRGRPSRLIRGILRSYASVIVALAGRLPPRIREPLLDLNAPLTIFTVGALWLATNWAGFTLLSSTPLREAEWLSTALLVVAITVYLLRFMDAYGRRERLVARLASSVCRPKDADALLAAFLRTGTRDHLDTLFSEWTGWMTDVESSHVAHPTLTFRRPSGELDWLKAAVIVLDVAALTESLAPSWAPTHTRALLDSGTKCLQRLAKELCIRMPPITVSLQGREERNFSDTVRLASEAGLPAERDSRGAWAVFQSLRTGYAPHAYAIETRLHYSPMPEGD